MNLLRDENGGILIMGVFALLFIGLGLLALSIDMPMTFNKEADAQMWLRKATAQAAKEMQYTMYRCEAERVIGSSMKVSDRPNNLWKNCPSGAGGLQFLSPPGGSWKPARDFMQDFVESNYARTKTQNSDANGVRFCVGGVKVKQTANEEYYLYAYLDYPQDGIFTQGQTGGANCECPNEGIGKATGQKEDGPEEGCNRVESGKLLTRKGDLPFQIKLMLAAELSARSAQDPDALNSVGNVLDVIGQMMANLGMGEE